MVTKDKSQEEWGELLADEGREVVPPGYMKAGEILNRPSEDQPAPMRVSDLAFKGYVEVWDTQTGIQSLQPRWLLWQALRKIRPDGSLVFTRVNPKIAPNHGADLRCPLNPASPDYPRLKAMGFKQCTKQHIPHQDALMRHVKKSHVRAWDAMEREREDRQREEDRQLQRDMLQAMTSAAVKGVAASQAPAGARQSVKAPSSAICAATCPTCTRVFTDRTQKLANNNLRMHQRRPCKVPAKQEA